MDLGSGLMHDGIFLEVYSATTFVSLYTFEMAYMGRADGRQYRSVCWRFSYGIFLGAYGEKTISLSKNKMDSMPIKSSLYSVAGHII